MYRAITTIATLLIFASAANAQGALGDTVGTVSPISGRTVWNNWILKLDHWMDTLAVKRAQSTAANYIPRFVGANGDSVINSGITDDGTTVKTTGRDLELWETNTGSILRWVNDNTGDSALIQMDENNLKFYDGASGGWKTLAELAAGGAGGREGVTGSGTDTYFALFNGDSTITDAPMKDGGDMVRIVGHDLELWESNTGSVIRFHNNNTSDTSMIWLDENNLKFYDGSSGGYITLASLAADDTAMGGAGTATMIPKFDAANNIGNSIFSQRDNNLDLYLASDGAYYGIAWTEAQGGDTAKIGMDNGGNWFAHDMFGKYTLAQLAAGVVPDSAYQKVLQPARKGSVGTIAQGAPVYVSGYNVGGWVEVEEADGDDPNKMPVMGVANVALTNSATGDVLMQGVLGGLATDTLAVNDQIWVSTTAGQGQDSKPTGASVAIQKYAEVTRSHVNAGQIVVFGAGRANDVPNLTDGYHWEGSALGVATAIPSDTIGLGAALAAAGGIGGSGTTNYFTKFTASNQIGNSVWTSDADNNFTNTNAGRGPGIKWNESGSGDTMLVFQDGSGNLAFHDMFGKYTLAQLAASGGSPGGDDNDVQYNISSAFTGENAFEYHPATDMLEVLNLDFSAAAAYPGTGTVRMPNYGSIAWANAGVSAITHDLFSGNGTFYIRANAQANNAMWIDNTGNADFGYTLDVAGVFTATSTSNFGDDILLQDPNPGGSTHMQIDNNQARAANNRSEIWLGLSNNSATDYLIRHIQESTTDDASYFAVVTPDGGTGFKLERDDDAFFFGALLQQQASSSTGAVRMLVDNSAAKAINNEARIELSLSDNTEDSFSLWHKQYGTGDNESTFRILSPSGGNVMSALRNLNVTFGGTITLPDDPYDGTWNALLEAPTKNAIFDEMELKADASSLLDTTKIFFSGVLDSLATTDTLYLGRIFDPVTIRVIYVDALGGGTVNVTLVIEEVDSLNQSAGVTTVATIDVDAAYTKVTSFTDATTNREKLYRMRFTDVTTEPKQLVVTGLGEY